MTADPLPSTCNALRAGPRSLPIAEWPDADRHAWGAACRPGVRLTSGGAASSLAQVSRDDYANRYGAFLGFLERTGRLDRRATPAAQVTLPNVDAYIRDLDARVRSVTMWNCVSKLRRAATLLAPGEDFSWLADIENDLALVMEPRSKLERLVLVRALVEAGLTLITEAEALPKDELERARRIRNGLMIAALAMRPIRLKNFAGLEIGTTLKKIHDRWWIALPASTTKTYRADEGLLPKWLTPFIELYLQQSRPVLIRSAPETNTFWISSRTGRAMTAKNLGILVSKVTFRTIGVDVSPHLFRTAAATSAAVYGPDTPGLGSALLNHADPRITELHYNRASSISAAITFADIVDVYRQVPSVNLD